MTISTAPTEQPTVAETAAPTHDGWTTHEGLGDPDVHEQMPVEVRFRDGTISAGRVVDWDQNWQWAQSEAGQSASGAIVAWRILPSFKAERDAETERFNETMKKKTPRTVLAAVRRLMPRNSKPNWSLAMDVYCVGRTYGWRICQEAGIDPEAKTVAPY
jgi:hypothetical protein